jgi:hypothetical protein
MVVVASQTTPLKNTIARAIARVMAIFIMETSNLDLGTIKARLMIATAYRSCFHK